MVLLLGLSTSIAGCIPPDPALGTLGEERAAYFSSNDTDKVFVAPLMVGSVFEVSAIPVDNDENGALAAGAMTSSDNTVLSVDPGGNAGQSFVRVEGPGAAYLHVSLPNGDEVDRILIVAAVAVSVEIADGSLKGAAVDPRLPAQFATIENGELPLFVAGLDRCGGPLLPVGVVELSTADAGVLEVERGGANDWTLRGINPGNQPLTLLVRGERWADYDVDVVTSGDVDNVDPFISVFDETSAQIWARAYADGREVIGLNYDWSADERVQLRSFSGTFNVATIGGGADAGSAEVDLSYQGDIVARLDLFAATTNTILSARVDPPTVAEPEPTSGCEAGVCDPFAAFLVGGFSLRRWRRRAQALRHH